MSTHFDPSGNACMVDVSGKEPSRRIAVAEGCILVSPEVLAVIRSGAASKGDVMMVAQLAGIMAAKRASDLIPLCHPLPLTHCTVSLRIEEGCVIAECTASTTASTGVEMEALTGVSTALLTVYDMCKSIDKSMEITRIRLLRKSGGKSGDYARP